MQLFQRSFLLLTLMLVSANLAGCSQKFNDVNDTLKLALFGNADTELDGGEIQNLPYASIYARIDDGPQAFMVLALAEPKVVLGSSDTLNAPAESSDTVAPQATQLKTQLNTQLKWLSSDSGMLVTEQGRLVKSLNLPQGNLIETFSNQADPLSLGLHLPNTPTRWQRRIDWQPGYHYGYQLASEFTRQKNAVVMINDRPVETLHFTETVVVSSLDTKYQNDFWLHPLTGKVLKSRQKLAPGLPYAEITILKPFS